MKDFGLGPSPSSKLMSDRKVSIRYSTIEEARASLLGIAFEAHLGLSWLKTLHEHSWDVKKRKREYEFESISEWLINNVEFIPVKSLNRVTDMILKIRNESIIHMSLFENRIPTIVIK